MKILIMFNPFSKKSSEEKTTKHVTFKIQGMHCVACSMNIDGELEDTPGVVSSTTSYASAVSNIEYDPKRISIEHMTKIVKKLGYDLTPASTD